MIWVIEFRSGSYLQPDRSSGPSVSHMVAVLLELCIVGTFTAHHSLVGLLLCAAYAWFSATWALFRKS